MVRSTAAGSLLEVSAANQVFGLSEAETLVTGAMAARGNLRIVFSLHPSCLTMSHLFWTTWVGSAARLATFWHLLFYLVIATESSDLWHLSDGTTRRQRDPKVPWQLLDSSADLLLCIDDTRTFVTAGPNRNSSKVTSWSGASTSQCGELSHTTWSQLSHFLNPE